MGEVKGLVSMIIETLNPEPASINYSTNNKKLVLNDVVYIPILKNAHRYTTNLFLAYGFTSEPNVDIKNKLKVVVLRDPIKRWFAGAAQFLYLHGSKITVDENFVEFLTKIVVLDGHTRSQVNYLNGIDTEECIFFNMDDSQYEETIKYYARRKFGGVVDMDKGFYQPDRLTVTSNQNDTYKVIKNKLETMCTGTNLDRLKHYFKDDYKLITNIEFFKIKELT